MNPDTYIHNELSDILYNDNVKSGDKITLYEFDNEEQTASIDIMWAISTDFHLDVNEVILKYHPDIETHKKMTYTYLRVEKSHGDTWVILLSTDGEERHINLSESFNVYYSVHALTDVAAVTDVAVASAVVGDSSKIGDSSESGDSESGDSESGDSESGDSKDNIIRIKCCGRTITYNTEGAHPNLY